MNTYHLIAGALLFMVMFSLVAQTYLKRLNKINNELQQSLNQARSLHMRVIEELAEHRRIKSKTTSTKPSTSISTTSTPSASNTPLTDEWFKRLDEQIERERAWAEFKLQAKLQNKPLRRRSDNILKFDKPRPEKAPIDSNTIYNPFTPDTKS